jgi:hypothetical protein
MRNKGTYQNTQPVGWKMFAKFAGTCRVCRKQIKVGDQIWYNSKHKTANHIECRHIVKVTKLPKAYPDGYQQTLLTRPFYGSSKNGRSK